MNLRARAGLTRLQLSAAPGQPWSEPSTVLRYAIAVLSVAIALDDRFHENCHKQGIPLGFRTPTYVACVHRRPDHGSVAAGD
jgi:hypothetical protein